MVSKLLLRNLWYNILSEHVHYSRDSSPYGDCVAIDQRIILTTKVGQGGERPLRHFYSAVRYRLLPGPSSKNNWFLNGVRKDFRDCVVIRDNLPAFKPTNTLQ